MASQGKINIKGEKTDYMDIGPNKKNLMQNSRIPCIYSSNLSIRIQNRV
jgi:hypothetical protein